MTMDELLSSLAALSITATTIKHDAVKTAAEHAAATPSLDAAGRPKNLFLKEKAKGDLYLITVSADSTANNGVFQTLLGVPKKSQLRNATEDVMMEVIGVAPGTVSPFALANDKEHKVQLVIDKKLMDLPLLHLHPLDSAATTSIAPADLTAWLKSVGAKEPILIDLENIPAPEPAAATGAAGAGGAKQPKPQAQKKAKGGAAGAGAAGDDGKQDGKMTKLGISHDKKTEFSEWYTQVVIASEMIDYYSISGCYILRPWAFKVWQFIQEWFTQRIEEMDVEPCYFPCFVPKSALEKEKDHVEGFAAEVAWVTKSGQSDLQEHIALRPTSETVMYPYFAKWIRSHRDLPLKLNQWCNVVRWEFKHPTPFIRTREFLWQEGHTAHATKEQAVKEVLEILDLYARIYEELLAVPVIKGRKSEKEKFAGGDMTTTVEGFIPANGRAIQGATSHLLGQNFAKMFEILYENEKGERELCWQNSWGCTTRTLGVMVMVHGDNTGLVMPPRVAPVQVVFVTIPMGDKSIEDVEAKKANLEEQRTALNSKAEKLAAELKAAGVRVKVDNRDDKTPGWKYNFWEQKGVPLRVELGPRDLAQGTAAIAQRFGGGKHKDTVEVDKMAPGEFGRMVAERLEAIQAEMLASAKRERDERLVEVTQWSEVTPALDKLNMVLAPWCESTACEEHVAKTSAAEAEALAAEQEQDERAALTGKAKTLCLPFAHKDRAVPADCFAKGIGCTNPAKSWTLWGRSY